MKKIFSFFIFFLSIYLQCSAQVNERHKIAVFTPLYLDSAFDEAGNFRYEKTGARFYNAGLDFYYGIELALDSLQKRNAPLEIYICDTKGKESITDQLMKTEMNDVEMIIGQTNFSETKLLAEAALKRKIPFISTTLPNDANVSANPYFVILNATLKTHVEGIYHFMQKYHSLDRIIVFRKPGNQEDEIKNYLTEFSRSIVSTPLNIQYVDLPEGFTSQTIINHLDSNKKNVCIAGSLDEAFGSRLAQILSTVNKTYPTRLIGMPTWENFNFNKLNELEIIYTNPFVYNRGNALETELTNDYTSKLSAKPGDLFFRGYDAMLRFGLLLLDTNSDVSSSITRKGNTVLTQYDIEPVIEDKSTMTLDYFENKHLYFIKVFGGVRNVMY